MAVSHAQSLRDLLAQPNVEIMPGCYDGLSAKLVADAGFKVTFMSGFAVSAARLGLPDTGLISFTEMLDSLRNCCAAAGKVPLIGDGDTGYGNALNVQRTVVEYARAGAACVMIEDQVSPKKCGHTRGKQVISREEARMKIRAAVDARADAEILIMARTDARAVHGFDEALNRCRDFEAEGADIIFFEAPETEDEMRRFCGAMKKPCMANMVPGGKTPILPPTKLQEVGYKLALYPVMLLSSAVAAMQATDAHQRGLVGGGDDDDRAGDALGPEVALDELAHLAATLADEADHVDVGRRRAGDHAQQRRLADAGAGEDAEALAAAARHQRVQRAHAERHALDDARALERIRRRRQHRRGTTAPAVASGPSPSIGRPSPSSTRPSSSSPTGTRELPGRSR